MELTEIDPMEYYRKMAEANIATAKAAKEKAEAEKSTTAKERIANYEDELFKRFPVKWYWIQARKAESKLDYEEAATMYTAAYDLAFKDGLVCTMPMKWAAMRCIEYAAIHEKLKKSLDPVIGFGKKLGATTFVYWMFEDKLMGREPLRFYKHTCPQRFTYNIVGHNRIDDSVIFVQSRDWFQQVEPTFSTACRVHKDGKVEEGPFNFPKPDIIKHKWMLVDPKDHSGMNYNDLVRRSIRQEFLRIPDDMKPFAQKREVWDRFIAPRIGNRNIGNLALEFRKELLSKGPRYFLGEL